MIHELAKEPRWNAWTKLALGLIMNKLWVSCNNTIEIIKVEISKYKEQNKKRLKVYNHKKNYKRQEKCAIFF